MKNLTKIILGLFIFSQLALAGLPPTSNQGASDSNAVTTFKTLFPNQTIYHNGTVATITQNGKPGKNYIQYADFENNATTGWSLGTIGTLTNGLPTGSPTFGSGASGNLSISVYTPPLAGAYSLRYFSGTASTAGNMLASSSYAIDPEDQAQAIGVKFYYSVTSGASALNWSGTSSNSLAWAAYDVTNSTWLSSWGNFCFQQSSGTGICNGGFQTGPTTANIRFVVYNANASTGLFGVAFDDFYVGPISTPQGYAGTDWVAYTPTFTGFGTPTNVVAYSRRVGANLEAQISFTSGTTTSVNMGITVGYQGGNANVTMNVSGILSTNNNTVIGEVATSEVTAASFVAIAPNVNSSTFSIGLQSSTLAGLTPGTASTSFTSGNNISIHISVPIVGWSSNTQVSTDSQNLSIAASYYLSTNSSSTHVPFDTKIFDSSGMCVTGASFACTAPQTGFYSVSFSGLATTGSNNITLYKNGSFYSLFSAVVSTTGVGSGNVIIQLNAGDNVYAGNPGGITLTGGAPSSNGAIFSIAKVPGGSQVQAPPTVAFDYYGSTQTVTSSAALIINPTKLVDTMNIMNTSTGLATAPYTGTYHCDCAIQAAFASANYVNLQFAVAGSSVGVLTGGSSSTVSGLGIGKELTVLAGQTIGCNVQSSGLTSTATGGAEFGCHRVGY